MVKYRSGSPAAAGVFCRFGRNIIPLTDLCCRIFSRIGKIFVFRHFLFYNAPAIAYDAVIAAVTLNKGQERAGFVSWMLFMMRWMLSAPVPASP